MERRRSLIEKMKKLEEDERKIENDLEMADEQIKYYRALIKEMKSEISPPLITRLLDAIGGR